jgi:predicted phage terminase large subunit-like protein
MSANEKARVEAFTRELVKAMEDPVTKARLTPAGWALLTGMGRWKLARHLAYLNRKLIDVASGRCKRLMIFMPPRCGKSDFVTIKFSSWYLGTFPHRRIIVTGYSNEFAQDFGRQARNLLEEYGEEVWGLHIDDTSKAANRWDICDHRGGMITAGANGRIVGKGAHLFIIDDPIKTPEQAASPTYQRKTYEWYQGAVRTRLQKGGAIILIMCMTGDTPVSMADGTRKRLDNIKVGDEILAWKSGRVVTCKIKNWSAQGVDDVFEIKTGNSTVRANSRHPFLVDDNGVMKWVRVADLNVGDKIVTSGRIDYNNSPTINELEAWLLGYMFGDGWITKINGKNYDKKRNKYYPKRGYATCVALSAYPEENIKVANAFNKIFGVIPKETKYGYRRTDIARIGRWFIDKGLTGHAKTKRIPDFVFSEPINIREAFLSGFNEADGHTVSNGYGKGRWVMTSVNDELIEDIRHLARGCGYNVTNTHKYKTCIQAPHSKQPIDSQLVTVDWNPWSRITEEFRSSAIRSIKPACREMVYDIEVEDAACFIADGLISHNTRWNENDLAGKLLQEAKNGGEQWEVIEFPAICEKEGDVLGRKIGEPLWPQNFDETALDAIRKAVGPYVWNAQYQQHPSPLEGGFFKKAWFRYFEEKKVREGEAEHTVYELKTGDDTNPVKRIPKEKCVIFFTVDTASKTGQRNDYTAIGVWAMTPDKELLLLDMFRERIETTQHGKVLRDLHTKWKPKYIGVEDKGAGTNVIQALKAELNVRPLREKADVDKQVRAYPVSVRFSNGLVYFNAALDKNTAAALEHELLTFPNGEHDDMVDVIAYAGIEAMAKRKMNIGLPPGMTEEMLMRGVV